ncbi:MAG: flavin reductase family protein [Planctomycetota bacterium]
MTIEPADANPIEVYRHLVHTVVPRPIGWISSRGTSGVDNLAPYSFFNAVCAKPAAVMFASTTTRDGKDKDSLRNVRETGEFVVNIVSEDVAEMMNKSAASLPYGESEFDHAGIEKEEAKTVACSRVKAAHVHFECTLHETVQIGEGPMSTVMVIGLVRRMDIADHLLGENGYVDPHKLAAVGRMGGNSYCRASDIFDLDRPA